MYTKPSEILYELFPRDVRTADAIQQIKMKKLNLRKGQWTDIL